MSTDASLTSALHKVMRRLLPFMMLLLLFNLLDRTNVRFAALQMNADFGFTPPCTASARASSSSATSCSRCRAT